jgi:Zn-dependent protease with chaperone function
MKVKKYFKDISPKAWEHPADRAALAAMKQIPGFDIILQKLIGITTEKAIRLIALSSFVRVTERQFPKIYSLREEACDILDSEKRYDVYVTQNPLMNAGAIGVENPFVILNSSLLDKLSSDELLCVIGHEIGHCLSGHVLYKTLLWLLISISSMFFQIPLAGIAIHAIMAALREWDRKSELSADRAGMLVVQDKKVAYELEMKMAGGSKIGEMNLDEFLIQAEEYDKGQDILDSVYKILNLLGRTHPFPVVRLAELKTWVDSGAYESILSGDYKRRSDAKPDDVMDEMGNAANQYKEDMARSKDPLAETLSKFGEGMELLGKQAEDFWRSIFEKDDKKP